MREYYFGKEYQAGGAATVENKNEVNGKELERKKLEGEDPSTHTEDDDEKTASAEIVDNDSTTNKQDPVNTKNQKFIQDKSSNS